MAPEGLRRRRGGEGFKLGEDLRQEGRDEGVGGPEGVGDLVDEVVPLHRPLLVAVEDPPDGVYLLRREVPAEELLHLAGPALGDPDVGAREPSEVETSIQNRQGLAPELLLHLAVLDDQRVDRLVEAEAEVRLPEPPDDVEDGVRPPVGRDAPWVAPV